MANLKEHPRYHVISMRVSDEEQSDLEELRRLSHQTISTLMRQAMHLYTGVNGAADRRQTDG